MTVALVESHAPEQRQPRPSASARQVASIIGCSPLQVRKMVASGELEGWTLGKRAIRVFLDSVADYQDRATVRPVVNTQTVVARSRRAAASAATLEAERRLRAAGFLR